MKIRILLPALLLLAAAGPISAEETPPDQAKGKALHETHCLQCHKAEVYTRAERKVSSLAALNTQVRRCELMLGLKWFDEDVASTASWLNKEYYKFPEPAKP